MRALLLFPLALVACSGNRREVTVTPQDEDLHHRAVVVDTHDDITEAIVYEGYDFLERHGAYSTDLPRMREGGLDAQFFSVFVQPEGTDPSRYHGEAMRQIDALLALAQRSGGALVPARTAGEVRANAAREVTSMLLGVEGGHMLLPGRDDELVDHVRAFAERGVRYMTLTWSLSSPLGGSSAEPVPRGITPLGRRVMAEMERLGMIVDLSHASDALFFDAIAAATKPLLLTHSSARALASHPRNATDEMLRAVARNGGAVCVNFSRTFLDDAFRAEVDRRFKDLGPMRTSEKARLYRAANMPDVPLSRAVDHIEHIARVAGVDHVCLGSDFDGIPMPPSGLEDVSKLPGITAELRHRGFSDRDVTRILGENVLRVMSAAEQRTR